MAVHRSSPTNPKMLSRSVLESKQVYSLPKGKRNPQVLSAVSGDENPAATLKEDLLKTFLVSLVILIIIFVVVFNF